MPDVDIDSVDILVSRLPRLFRSPRPRVSSYLSAGWLDLVSSALHDVDGLLAGASAYDLFEIHQIKEKFGRLRIYWSLEREGELALTVHPETKTRLRSTPLDPSELFVAIRERIDAAERETGSVCELCGAAASHSSSGGWHSTLCDSCRAKREATG